MGVKEAQLFKRSKCNLGSTILIITILLFSDELSGYLWSKLALNVRNKSVITRHAIKILSLKCPTGISGLSPNNISEWQ